MTRGRHPVAHFAVGVVAAACLVTVAALLIVFLDG